MKRLVPYLVFVLVAGGVTAFVFKDKLFPPSPAAQAQAGGGGRRSGGGGAGGPRRGGNQPVPVTVDKASTADVPIYLAGVGTIQAFNTATVRAQVSGRLTEVSFTEGQDVKQGDLLAKIDPVLYQAAYDQAVAKKALDEALLENARRDMIRYASLAKSEASSQQQADTARSLVAQNEAQVRQDQAAIDTAKANLDYATVRAPIKGRTGLRLVDMGNLVSATDATGIVVITQLQPITAIFTLPENYVAEILTAKAQSRVPLQAVTGSDVISEGTLEVVDNQVDQTTGTVRLKGSFSNETNRLWPGQYVNVRLRLKVLQNAVVIPSAAVQQGASGSFVYVVTPDNTAKITQVKVTQEGPQQSVIGEGIAANDTVITSGFANLQDGSRLRIDAPGSASSAPGAAPGSESGQDRTKRRRDNNGAPQESGNSGGNESRRGERRKRAETQGADAAAAAPQKPASPAQP